MYMNRSHDANHVTATMKLTRVCISTPLCCYSHPVETGCLGQPTDTVNHVRSQPVYQVMALPIQPIELLGVTSQVYIYKRMQDSRHLSTFSFDSHNNFWSDFCTLTLCIYVHEIVSEVAPMVYNCKMV